MQSNKMSLWSEAHIFYNQFNTSVGDSATIVHKRNFQWRQKMMNETPNGKLLIENSFFNSAGKKGKIRLAHITFGLDEIEESKSIYVSGGCLVGSVYCVPLVEDDYGSRIHNLGEYIYNNESYILANKHYAGKKPNVLVFELENSEAFNQHLIGIDYLGMGNIHMSIYKELEYLLSVTERFNLQELVLKKIKNSISFLNLCTLVFHNNHPLEPEKFIDCYLSAIGDLPILGYLYFEAVSEYIMLHQDSPDARKYLELGEIYNAHYKELMYALEPDLRGNFKLSHFRPSWSKLCDYIKANNIVSNFDEKQFGYYIAERLLVLVMSKLLKGGGEVNWNMVQWDFNNVVALAEPLIGHLIHRELRNYGRYPSFYFYFDQTKALQIWNYWNHMDIAIPFNGIIPKGEVGINPAYSDLKYKVYKTEVVNKGGFTYIQPKQEIDVSIEPRLVALRYTTMRNKSESVNLKK